MIDPATALRVDGKAALITGGTRGIGRAIAEACAAAGADICVVARKPAELDETRQSIEALGVRCVTVQGSVADPEVAESSVATMVAELGRCDFVVNNAAVNPAFGPLMDADMGAVAKVFDANIAGPLRFTRAASRPGTMTARASAQAPRAMAAMRRAAATTGSQIRCAIVRTSHASPFAMATTARANATTGIQSRRPIARTRRPNATTGIHNTRAIATTARHNMRTGQSATRMTHQSAPTIASNARLTRLPSHISASKNQRTGSRSTRTTARNARHVHTNGSVRMRTTSAQNRRTAMNMAKSTRTGQVSARRKAMNPRQVSLVSSHTATRGTNGNATNRAAPRSSRSSLRSDRRPICSPLPLGGTHNAMASAAYEARRHPIDRFLTHE